MPNEPDNKMDDLLKAYAKKRKVDAGEPLELHPATRRLLQAEAAKLRPRPDSKSGSWFSLVLARWPGIALAVGLFVLLGVGVRLMLPVHERSGRQMFAKQDAVVDRVKSSEERSKDGVQKAKDEVPMSPKLSRDEKKVAGAEKSAELAVSDSRKPADAYKALSETQPAPSPPWPAPFLRTEAAPSATPASPPPGRELDFARAPKPAPVSAPVAPQVTRRALPAEAATSDSLGLVSLGTFTNSSQLPEVSLQLASQAVGGISGVERKQVEPRASVVSEPQTPVPTPAQGQAVALADSDSQRQRRLSPAPPPAKASQNEAVVRFDNSTANVSQTQTAPAQTAQTAQTANVRLANVEDRQARVSGGQRAAGELRGNAGVAPQAPGPEPNYRYVANAGSSGSSRVAVLTSFDLQQRGDRVRVLDSDGSIYEGTVLATNGAVGASFAEADVGLQRQADALAKSTELKRQESGVAGRRAISFRVEGTNRTLNLPVMVEGSLFAGPTDRPVAATGFDGQQPPAVNRPKDNATPLALDRIIGRARIGATNEVRIDATRTRN